MGYLKDTVLDRKYVTVFPIAIWGPLNVSNSSRENAIRTNLGRNLEKMTLVQLDALLQELRGRILIDPEWPVCLHACGQANHAVLSAAEIGSAVAGVIHARKQAAAAAAKEPPAPTPNGGELLAPSFKRTLFWGGAALAAVLLVNQIQGGTNRAGF